MVKTKIEELDYLRGLAMIAIVMQHVMGYVNHPWAGWGDKVALSVIWQLINFGVPAFVFISGASLFYSYGSVEDFRYTPYLLKRIKLILLPYLLWTIIYYYSSKIQISVNIWQQASDLFYYFITGRVSYHLWFVVMIFQFYLLYPLFLKAILAIKNTVATEKGILLIIMVFFLIYMVITWAYVDIVPGIGEKTDTSRIYLIIDKYSYLLFIWWIFYFVWGGIGGLSPDRFREWIRRLIPYNIFIWCGLFFYQLYTYSAFSLYRPSVVLFVTSTIINIYQICVWLSRKENNIISQLLSQVSKYSFSIYLAHPLVLDLIATKLYSVPYFNPTQKFLLSVLLTFLIIIPGTFFIKLALAYIKFFTNIILNLIKNFFNYL